MPDPNAPVGGLPSQTTANLPLELPFGGWDARPRRCRRRPQRRKLVALIAWTPTDLPLKSLPRPRFEFPEGWVVSWVPKETLINHVLAAAPRIGRSGTPTSGHGHPVHAPDAVAPSHPARAVLPENSIDQRFPKRPCRTGCPPRTGGRWPGSSGPRTASWRQSQVRRP